MTCPRTDVKYQDEWQRQTTAPLPEGAVINRNNSRRTEEQTDRHKDNSNISAVSERQLEPKLPRVIELSLVLVPVSVLMLLCNN